MSENPFGIEQNNKRVRVILGQTFSVLIAIRRNEYQGETCNIIKDIFYRLRIITIFLWALMIGYIVKERQLKSTVS
jgi:hypothetical protein